MQTGRDIVDAKDIWPDKARPAGERVTCVCTQLVHDGGFSSLVGLTAVREQCAALKLLLAPDDVWKAIVAEACGSPDKALHCSCLLKAYDRGTLNRITGPVHRFLLMGSELHASLTNQYRQDLQERWLSETDEISRHEKFRMFLGKLIELQVADWLSTRRWRVRGLEALGETCDIAAFSPEEVEYAIEVKYIGQGEDDFNLVLDSLSGGTGVGPLPLYGAINYLLFRVFEAAVSLRRHQSPKLAIVVVDAQAWPGIQLPLENGWLNWQAPAFLATEERDWNEFLDNQRRGRYRMIDADLSGLIRGLSQVLVLRFDNDFEYSLAFEHRFAG